MRYGRTAWTVKAHTASDVFWGRDLPKQPKGLERMQKDAQEELHIEKLIKLYCQLAFPAEFGFSKSATNMTPPQGGFAHSLLRSKPSSTLGFLPTMNLMGRTCPNNPFLLRITMTQVPPTRQNGTEKLTPTGCRALIIEVVSPPEGKHGKEDGRSEGERPE